MEELTHILGFCHDSSVHIDFLDFILASSNEFILNLKIYIELNLEYIKLFVKSLKIQKHI